MWDALAQPWQGCLEEAWGAYCSGSIPIGAAIADAQGQILARGRNRVFERSAPDNALSGSRLAHAEINALIAVNWEEVDPRRCVLYSTTEPYPLCIGAIRVTGIGAVQIAGPGNTDLETLIVALHVEFSLRTGHLRRSSWTRQQWQATVPDGVSRGEELLHSGQLQRWRDEGASVAEVVTRLCRTNANASVV